MSKMLLLSDTHGNLTMARRIIELEKPDRILHLGDLMTDARALAAEFPQTRLEYVPGNCDAYSEMPLVKYAVEDGGTILYTHGHEFHVKLSLMRLELAAREAQVQVAAFGHTHRPYCELVNGLWLVNPGSAQRLANYARVEIKNGISVCSLHTIP